jgi:hypothetical protein
MRASVFILAFCLFIFSACKKDRNRCVDSKIDDFKKTAPCSSGAKVDEYKFQGNTAYVFEPGNCGADMTSEVLNDKCETIGFLGGISGNTKINGEDFSNAKFQKTLWSN